MKQSTRNLLFSIFAFFGVFMGSAFAIVVLATLVVGPGWNWIVGFPAWLVLIFILFEVRGGDVWQWLFPGSPRPKRARNR